MSIHGRLRAAVHSRGASLLADLHELSFLLAGELFSAFLLENAFVDDVVRELVRLLKVEHDVSDAHLGVVCVLAGQQVIKQLIKQVIVVVLARLLDVVGIHERLQVDELE